MKVYAPGKLIISGEHAIVHGAPAIAIAVNRYATTTITKSSTSHLSLALADFKHESDFNLSALKNIKDRIKRKYKRFVNGEFSIRKVLQKPVELAHYAMGLFTDSFNITLPHGVNVQVQSDIPVGCGMGSSAASILSVMYAMSEYLHVPMPTETLYKLALEAENMQHGFSSGLDLRVALNGGCVYVNGDAVETRQMANMPMYLINSGKPASTTGECVESVASYFKQDLKLKNDFAAVTNAIDQAIQQQDVAEMQRQLRLNHKLLVSIGVVPSTIQRFIADIETAGGAAKICGAGAIAGEQAGAILAMTDDSQQLTEVANQYGFKVAAIQAESRGVHVV